MQSITTAFNNLSHTIKEAIQHTPPAHVYTRKDVAALEEAERERRMHQSAAQIAQANATRTSSLFHDLRSPYLRGSSAGFKRITARLEEQERARRLMTKPELALRKMNANLSAGMIRALGWPLFKASDKQGPIFIYASEPALLAEQERLDRINNPLQAQLAKSNAALVANALRWGWTGLPLGAKRFTRALEEKERARRLSERDELAFAAEGAYQQAGLIRNLGLPFYVQGENHVDTASLEHVEQARRLSDKNEQVRARQHAAIVSRLLPIWASGKSTKRAEQERARRMSDFEGEQRAMEIAKQLSTIVAGPTIDEQVECERERRIRHAEHDRLVAHQVADLIQGLRFSKSNAHDLYEKEARRRLRDATGERIARQNANKIAALVSSQPSFGAVETPSIANVEEIERKQRMYDWPTQQMQMRNARRASDMIKAARAGRKQSPSFATEKERHRRMVDAGLQAVAIQNAKKVSEMVRSNTQPLRPVVPATRAAPAVIPSATDIAEAVMEKAVEGAEAAKGFFASVYDTAAAAGNKALNAAESMASAAVDAAAAMAPVSFFPETSMPRDLPNDFMPPAETMRETLPFQDELLEKRAMAPPAVLPFKNELLHSRSEAPALLPFKNELLERQPSFIHEQQRELPFKNELLERQPSFHPQQEQQRELPFKDELLENTRAAPAVPPFKSELLQKQPAMASAPISNIPMASAPLMSQPLAQPLSATNPFAAQQPLSSAPLASVAPASVAPLAQPSTPLAYYPQMDRSVPMSSAPLTSAPLSSIAPSYPQMGNSIPMSSAPLTSAPLSVAPLAQPSTPLASWSTPSYPQTGNSIPMSSVPLTSAPLYSGAPQAQALPMTSARSGLGYLSSASPLTSGAPLGSSASLSAASLYPTSNQTSFYSAAGEHAMTEQQRRRLEKQALKHNRKAAKDNRQAEKLIQKAEKLHARGKDSRAVKKESKAEQKVISSKQHALWANDLLAKNGSATQTPVVQAAPATFYPAM